LPSGLLPYILAFSAHFHPLRTAALGWSEIPLHHFTFWGAFHKHIHRTVCRG